MSYNQLHQLSKQLDDMRRQAREMAEEAKRLEKLVGWSDWEPHTVGIIPMRVNGRWYFKGDTVYRKEKMWGLSGSRRYKYGDDFDVLKDV